MTDVETRFEQVRGVVDTTPEEEIPVALEREVGGLDEALDVVFNKFQRLFDPERAGAGKGVFQYTILTPEAPRHYAVHVVDGTCRVERGVAKQSNVTMTLGLTDFLQLASGTLSGQEAFMSGKLQVAGDMFFSMNWSQWFATP